MIDTQLRGHEAPEASGDKLGPGVFGQTPWQTVGPFFHYGLPWKGGADLVGVSDLGARADLVPEAHYLLNTAVAKGAVAGERIEIRGRVLDGDGAPASDAMLEIWQANAAGRYASLPDDRLVPSLKERFTGFGRSATSVDGAFRFLTVRPGRTPGPGGALQAPHIAVSVFARGLLKRLVTRLYFADEPSNAEDPVLERVPPDRRSTLIAQRDGGAWRFDVVLQGDNETVFFDL